MSEKAWAEASFSGKEGGGSSRGYQLAQAQVTRKTQAPSSLCLTLKEGLEESASLGDRALPCACQNGHLPRKKGDDVRKSPSSKNYKNLTEPRGHNGQRFRKRGWVRYSKHPTIQVPRAAWPFEDQSCSDERRDRRKEPAPRKRKTAEKESHAQSAGRCLRTGATRPRKKKGGEERI